MKTTWAGLLAIWLIIPTGAVSGTEADDLKRELQQLRQDYEKRIQVLEERLQRLETTPPPISSPALTNAAVTTPVSPDAAAETARERGRTFARQQFQRNTETRDRALIEEQDQPIRERVEQVLKDFVDISGYFRAGYGVNDQGGVQTAFQAPGAGAKYRLGNEAENYGELVFGRNWYTPGRFAVDPAQRPGADAPTGPVARTQVRVSFMDDYATHDFRTALPEAWASIGNVWEAQPNLKFWAGNRFYRRHDIHVLDFFFYNMSGYGGGMEDLQTPIGKVALAWIGNSAQSSIFNDVILPDPEYTAGFAKRTVDLRLYDVKVPLGKAEIGLAYACGSSGLDPDGNHADLGDGVALNLVHTRENFLSKNGFNMFSLQAGTGAAKTFTSGFETVQATNGAYYIIPDETDSWRFRVTEQFVAKLNPHLSLGPVLVYQYTDYNDLQGRRHWFSGGIRPIYHFNRYLSVAFEGGMDYVDDSAADQNGKLWKLTLAPQVSLGGSFMSRPVLRAFVTYAGWTDDFKGEIGGQDYINRTHGWTWGVQMESWW
jgi:maltoporin